MKADESADCAGSCGSSFPAGLCLSFFWGLKISKYFKRKMDFGWGQI
jgi:hypothetical protein